MRRRLICNAMIIAAGLLIFMTLLINYISVDTTDFAGFSLQYLTPVFSGLQSGDGGYTTLSLLQGVFRAQSALDENGLALLQPFLDCLLLTLGIPYVVALIALLFGSLRSRWTYGVVLLASVGGLALLCVSGGWLIPNSLREALGIGVITILDSISELTGTDAFAKLRTLLIQSLGPGFWITVGAFVIMIFASVAGLLYSKK